MERLGEKLNSLLAGAPVIVVSGIPRSGTSMVMQMLEAGGVACVTDNVRQSDGDNPRGYYEDERVKHLGRDSGTSWLRGCRGRAVKVISHLLPRLPLLFRYRVVFIERDLDDVMKSQRRMLRHLGEPSGDADDRVVREKFLRHLGFIRDYLDAAPGFETLYLNYGEVVRTPREAARRLNLFLGGSLDVDAMSAAVDGSLSRARKEE